MVVKNQRPPKFRRLVRTAEPEKSKRVNLTKGRCGDASGTGRYGELGGGVRRYGELGGGVREIRGGFRRYSEIWGGIRRYSEVRGDTWEVRGDTWEVPTRPRPGKRRLRAFAAP